MPTNLPARLPRPLPQSAPSLRLPPPPQRIPPTPTAEATHDFLVRNPRPDLIFDPNTLLMLTAR